MPSFANATFNPATQTPAEIKVRTESPLVNTAQYPWRRLTLAPGNGNRSISYTESDIGDLRGAVLGYFTFLYLSGLGDMSGWADDCMTAPFAVDYARRLI